MPLSYRSAIVFPLGPAATPVRSAERMHGEAYRLKRDLSSHPRETDDNLTKPVEDAYLMEYESSDDFATGLRRFIEACNNRRLHSALGYLSPSKLEDRHARAMVKTSA